MNLIITPVYKAFDIVKQMCDNLDKNAELPFYHVLVCDNCGDIPEIEVSQNRGIITFRNDFIPGEHKNRAGQGMDLAYQFGMQKCDPYGDRKLPDYIFLIESDVFPPRGFDSKLIDLSQKLEDWASLDVNSIDKEGKVTYPTTVSPRYGHKEFGGHTFEHMHYPDFQCTLFNPQIFERTGIRFSDIPDHFDVLWGRKTTEMTGWQHYRTKEVEAYHVTFASRSQLPEELAKSKQ
jgi:hypothetical protein